MAEKRPLLFDLDRVDHDAPIVTRAQALRIAKRKMPADLKRSGFIAHIAASDMELHGGSWWRAVYSK